VRNPQAANGVGTRRGRIGQRSNGCAGSCVAPRGDAMTQLSFLIAIALAGLRKQPAEKPRSAYN
jgi:hypothetical protein